MTLADRGMKRSEFRKLTQTSLKTAKIQLQNFNGNAGILEILETDGVWKVRSSGEDVIIAAPGYKWLQLAPSHGRWWLTVMYSPEDELIQYYFDITKRHYMSDDSEMRFIDMFLDVVMLPDGSYEILDRDEFESAFRSERISEFDYRIALVSLYKLIANIHDKEAFWRKLCRDAISEVNKKCAATGE